MLLNILKSKIHRATVTQSELDYVGSITIDKDLLEASNIIEYEKVSIVNINNGSRFETYVIEGKKGSKIICLNGAAARMVAKNDKIIIMAYTSISHEKAVSYNPKVVFVDDNNNILKISNYEKHGKLSEE